MSVRRRLLGKRGGSEPVSPYVMDGLIIWFDAIKQIESGNKSKWVDFSPQQNQNVLTTFYVTYWMPTYVDAYRAYGSFGTSINTLIAGSFTFEISFQRYAHYWNKESYIIADGNHDLIRFGSNSSLLTCDGRFYIPGNNNKYGTAQTDYAHIIRYSLTYDGSKLINYINGIKDTEVSAVIDNSLINDVYYFGYTPYGAATNASYNSLRIYSRALSDVEIFRNYQYDITRFGTVNIEVS